MNTLRVRDLSIGDKLRCANDKPMRAITTGKEYTVVEVHPDRTNPCLFILDDGGQRKKASEGPGNHLQYFELAEPAYIYNNYTE